MNEKKVNLLIGNQKLKKQKFHKKFLMSFTTLEINYVNTTKKAKKKRRLLFQIVVGKRLSIYLYFFSFIFSFLISGSLSFSVGLFNLTE